MGCFGSSHSRLDSSLSAVLRDSCSPSRTSSWCGSRSLGASRPWSHAWSGSPFQCVDEGQQEEYSSVELINVIACIFKTCNLLPAPSEGNKICSLHTGLNADEQPSLSYWPPIRDVLAEILSDLNDCISPTTTGRLSKKVS